MKKVLYDIQNFDLLRLLFAGIVFWFHISHLASLPSIRNGVEPFINTTMAIQGFFIISGFLIFMSYEKSSSLREYFGKRLRRIYPAYVFVILLCAIGGAFLTTLSMQQYFTNASLYTYLVVNLVFLNFLQPSLPGVFGSIYHSMNAVNGALWTIKVEVEFYLAVPILVYLFRKYNKWIVYTLLSVLSYGYFAFTSRMLDTTGTILYAELRRQLPGQLGFFLTGAMLYYYFPLFKKYANPLLAGALIVYVSTRFLDADALLPVSYGIIVVYAGACLPQFFNAGKYGDFSYGLYILHFPILQALITTGIFRTSPIAGIFLALALVGAAAFLSWHYVEKPFLKRSSHYVQAESRNAAS